MISIVPARAHACTREAPRHDQALRPLSLDLCANTGQGSGGGASSPEVLLSAGPFSLW